MAKTSELTAIDLFAGAGGLTVGLKQAGFQVLAAVEIDPLACETYSSNHRGVALYSTDIRKLAVTRLLEDLALAPGELDLLAGCPPCQGFSSLRTLNRGASVPDKRNDLVFDFLRYVRVLKPKAVMLENVPGLDRDERMSAMCAALSSLGYAWTRAVVDAADYGVPQRRRRMVLLASKRPGLAIPSVSKSRSTVRDAIGGLLPAGRSKDALHDVPESRSEKTQKLIAKIPRDGGSRSSLPKRDQLACHQRLSGFGDVYGRMAWNEVSPTITSGCTNPSRGRFLHPTEDRAITPREAALLQTFPPKYKFSLRRGKENVAVLIGNALPPKLIKVFGRAIAIHLGGWDG